MKPDEMGRRPETVQKEERKFAHNGRPGYASYCGSPPQKSASSDVVFLSALASLCLHGD
jgi:hypothetical protein